VRFSPDTSRLIEGRLYWWTWSASETPSTAPYEGPETNLPHHLWGDEVIPPVVEVEPERPAWVPPVCPAGQVYLDSVGQPELALCPLANVRFPPPAWPPRIGEIVEVRCGDEWVPSMVTSGPWGTEDNRGARCLSGGDTIYRDREGKDWRWVYRDLSGYVPPGGGQ
jgi:hypothetical protein